MAVEVSIQLPNQPAIGGVEELPLGGPGRISPTNCQDVTVSSVSDASGGLNIITIHTDPRWTCLVSYITCAVGGAAVDRDIAFDLLGSRIGVMGPSLTSTVPSGLAARLMWTPPPYLGTTNLLTTDDTVPFRIRATITNVDTETLLVSARIYNFEKNIEQRVPLSQLLSVLPRN